MRHYVTYLLLLVSILLSACQGHRTQDGLLLKPVKFADLSDWQKDDHAKALSAFRVSCQKMMSLPKDRKLHISGIGGTYADWQAICQKANQTSSSEARHFFEQNFFPFLAGTEEKQEGLFTGYYEVVLYGSRKNYGPFQNALYTRPADLAPDQPYYSRKEIEEGKLDGKKLELMWLNDPIMSFFLHIQGSGVVVLEDDTMVRVGYDGKNNQPYTALGRYMLEQEWLEKDQVTAQTIQQWLMDHPYYADEVMQENASYVFFREVKGANGPIGGQGVALTPERSLAVDTAHIPYGVPIWLETALTGNKDYPKRLFNQLMVAQDTGGAIKGAVRGDIFLGSSEAAQAYAGAQNERGRYFLLLPK